MLEIKIRPKTLWERTKEFIAHEVAHFLFGVASSLTYEEIPATALYIFFQTIDYLDKKEVSDKTQDDIIFFTLGLLSGKAYRLFARGY